MSANAGRDATGDYTKSLAKVFQQMDKETTPQENIKIRSLPCDLKNDVAMSNVLRVL